MEDNNKTPSSIARKRRKLIMQNNKIQNTSTNKENMRNGPSTPALQINPISHDNRTTPLTDIINFVSSNRIHGQMRAAAPVKKKQFETSP